MEVTLNDLVHYRDRKTEIKAIRKLIETGAYRTKDSVKGSSSEFPYTETVISIEGYEQRRAERAKKKLGELLEKCEAVDVWLDKLTCERDRAILKMRFVLGYNYRRIALETRALDTTDDAARMQIARAMKKYFT